MMAQVTYGVMLIPTAKKAKMDLLLAMIFGDAPGTPELTRALVPNNVASDGSVPATDWCGGMPMSTDLVNTLLNLSTDLPTPPNGSWPWTVNSVAVLTEADALDAVVNGPFYLNTNTEAGVDLTTQAQENFATVLAAKSLQPIAAGL